MFKDRPHEASRPPTHHVGRHRTHTHCTDPDAYNGRTYSTRTATYSGGAKCAGCAAHRRTPPVRGRPPRPLPPPATRRHAPPSDLAIAASRSRDEAAASASTPPSACSAAAEPPASRAVLLPPLPVQYTGRGRSPDGNNRPQTSSRQPDRRGQCASRRPHRAAARLPARRGRGANACICERKLRDASSVSGRGSSGVAGARQVAGEHSREQQQRAADSMRSRRVRRGGKGCGRRTGMISRTCPARKRYPNSFLRARRKK